VDDGSTDSTDEILTAYCKKDHRFQFHHRPENRPKGANACRNYGFELSKGEYIIFIDSDDVLSLECLENRVSYLTTRNIDFVVYDTSRFRNNVYLNKSINRDPEVYSVDNYLLLFLSCHIPWTIMSVLWKRNIIQKFSFDEKLGRFQDVDFHIRVLLSKKITFDRIQKIDTYYRQAGDQKTNNPIFNKVVVDGLIALMIKLCKNQLLKARHFNALKRLLFTMSRDFVYFTTPRNIENTKLFISEFQNCKFVNFKERIIFKTMWWYVKYNCYNRKGFGFFRFRKFANAYFDKVSISE